MMSVTEAKSRTMVGSIVIVGLLLFWGFSWAIEYVESSNGLAIPAWEGGDTEIEFGDMNGDGNLDMVSIGDHGSPYINTQEHGIMVYFGDGAGSWSVHQEGNFGYGGCAVGDANGDGFMDVGYGMHHNYSSNDFGDQLIEVALGDGTGMAWTPWDDGLATNGEDYGMFATDFGDVDNDGDLDLVSNSFGASAGVHVYINNGDGTWTQSFGFTGGNSGDHVEFGDIDNDGNLDFVVTQQYGTVYFGDGTGNFTLGDYNLPGPGLGGQAGLSLGDVDRDGGAELSWVTNDGAIEVYKFDSVNTMWTSLSGNLPTSGTYRGTQLYDMNSDGWLDMVAMGTAVVVTWIGSHTNPGNWTWATYTSTGPSPGNMSAFRVDGDADHNGFADYAVVVEEGSYPNETNHLRFFEETSVATELSVTPMYPLGYERMIGGSVRFIEWVSAVPQGQTATMDLDLSISGEAGPWIPIAQGIPNNGKYQWVVPSAFSSSNCVVRYSVHTATDTATTMTYNPFVIVGEGGMPVLVVQPTLINFDTVYIDSSAFDSFVIWNAGSDTLHVQEFGVNLDVYQLSAGSDSLELAPDDSVTVVVSFHPTQAAAYPDSISINSDGGNQIVRLIGVGIPWSDVGYDGNAMVQRFELGDPYPNPFNAVVTLPLHISRSRRVELSVVNVLGQRVARIYSGNLDPGDYRLQWDANEAASGVYFLVLTVDDRTRMTKVALMR
jgi:hypothetical protein